MEKAAIDRIEEGMAVLLLGPEERQIIVPLNQLPSGVVAGDWLRVTVVNGRLKQVELDSEETKKRRDRIKAKLDKLFKSG